MRKWGILVTTFYVLMLGFLVFPGMAVILGEAFPSPLVILKNSIDPELFFDAGLVYWSLVAVFTAGQALLFFVSVDTTGKRMQPRRHVAVSVATITIASGLLAIVTIFSVLVAYFGENHEIFDSTVGALLTLLIFWVIWGTVFYYYRDAVSGRLHKAVSWLIAGSVLELLVVVPCHIIVRQRGDCSAPGLTAFGIATGIAVMLMALGPSIFFLYQKRLRRYGEPIPKRDS